MKNFLIISFFAVLCGVSLFFPQMHLTEAQAAPEKKIPATHMWIHTGNGMTFMYVSSVQQCEMYTEQAASINSSHANCYNQNQMVKSVKCTKNPTGGANCS